MPETAMMAGGALDPRDYDKATKGHAAKALARLDGEARGAEVRCATQSVSAAQPWQGILKVARARGCDAIVIASHGRGGLGGLILGSQTARVLAHSKIPVLVIR
jgi:nucleotide-binding universal stress UspA family protein